jgi:hypothetical protein
VGLSGSNKQVFREVGSSPVRESCLREKASCCPRVFSLPIHRM